MNADERAAQTPEGSGNALPTVEQLQAQMRATPPPEIQRYNRLSRYEVVGISGERVPMNRETRSLGHIVSRVQRQHWLTSMSPSIFAGLLCSLELEGQWPLRDDMIDFFGPALDCEYAESGDCEQGDLASGIVERHLLERSSPVQAVLQRPFTPLQLVEATDGSFCEFFNFNCRTTGFEILKLRLERLEHELHLYGYQSSTRVLTEACRILSGKLLLALCIAFNVPVADAAHTGFFGWSEFNTWTALFLFWWSEFLVLVNAISLALATSTVCYATTTPMGASDVHDACRRGDLPRYVCDMHEITQSEYYRLNTKLPTAYHVPVERCGERVSFDFLWVVKCVLVSIAFLLASGLAVRATCFVLKLTSRVIRRSATAFLTLRSHLQEKIRFRSSLRVVKQATGEMTGVPSAAASKPVYRMMGMVANSFDSLEMSMSGSEIRTSGVVPGCVYLVMVTDGEVLFIGMAFRYENYLVTAHHNVHAMSSTPGKSYIVPFKPNRSKENSELDMDSMLELTEEMMSRDIVSSRYAGFDATVIPMAAADWSRLGVQALKHGDAIWNTGVTAYGLEKSGKRKLQRSMGSIIKGDDHELTDVFYSASTLKGWSGSPILSGQKRVVALHCGTNGQQNRGLNFAYIRFFIDVHETSSLENDYPEGKKYLKSFRGSNGRLAMRREELELERLEDEAHDLAGKVFVNRTSNGLVWMSDSATVARSSRPATTEFTWSDECALPITQQEPRRVEEVVPEKPVSPRRSDVFAFATNAPFVVEKTKTIVSAPYYKGRLERHDEHVDMVEAKRLGYEAGVFEMPRAVDRESANERAKKSLSLNLAESVRVRSDFDAPADAIRSEAKMLIMDMLKPIRYETDCTGVTKQKILDQLNSSAVSSSKSPGLPFILEGYTTNAQMIAGHADLDELAERIYQSWLDGTWCVNSVNFHKIEPTKVAKLDAGMDRTVQSVGTGAQIIMRCFFGELMDASVSGSRKSPIVAGWSPLRPGDGKFMYESLARKGHQFLGYDGQNFEFTAHTEEAYLDVSDVMVGLAFSSPKVSKERVREWRREAHRVLDHMGRAGYNCADGTVISKQVAFVLSSGRYDTYIRNTITGLYWFTVGCLTVGLSHDEIKAVLKKFGGDDVIISVKPDFKTDELIAALRSYGLKIHKIELTEQEDGFEFFSWHFTRKNGVVTWVPTRFSKHVENFFNTKHEFRADALVAHMLNWVHSPAHFDFWKAIFFASRKASPDGYPLEILPDREQLLYHLQGYESLIRDPELIEAAFGKALVEQKGCGGSDGALHH